MSGRHLFGPDSETKPIVLSYGMGVDSTALLLRWLHEPDSRDFDLKFLTVLTAMTGDEFADTERLVATHILHRLRNFRVRFVQVARSGALQADGVTVLDDSHEPTRLFIQGDFTLSQELLSIGTVPQVATGQRRCTHHFKGFPLTNWTNREFADAPIRHVLGYNADEKKRVERSEGYSTDARRTEYPLMEWGWGREQCEKYVAAIVGETWRKSCCTFCPFASGKPDVLQRYREFPADAAEALFLEHIALAFNPNMRLYGSKSLLSVLEADGNTDALRLFEERLNEVPWAIYRVRRIVWAKGRADRKTERLAEGTRVTISTALLGRGGERDGDNLRLYVRRRGVEYPTLEEMLVVAPAVPDDKCRPSFEGNWDALTRNGLFDGELSG